MNSGSQLFAGLALVAGWFIGGCLCYSFHLIGKKVDEYLSKETNPAEWEQGE